MIGWCGICGYKARETWVSTSRYCVVGHARIRGQEGMSDCCDPPYETIPGPRVQVRVWMPTCHTHTCTTQYPDPRPAVDMPYPCNSLKTGNKVKDTKVKVTGCGVVMLFRWTRNQVERSELQQIVNKGRGGEEI